MNARLVRRLATGCYECGGALDDDAVASTYYCGACRREKERARVRRQSMRRYWRRRNAGECVRCGRSAAPGSHRCTRCAERGLDATRQSRERRRRPGAADQERRILSYLAAVGQWRSTRGVADAIGISPTAAAWRLHRLLDAGTVECRPVPRKRIRLWRRCGAGGESP